jgi:Rod binding domain-containing protein
MTIQPAQVGLAQARLAADHGLTAKAPQLQGGVASEDGQLREVFNQFIGETFYGQMLKAMRQTVPEPAYFHGGRAEEAFQGQLDQVLAQKMSESTASSFTQAMFELSHLAPPT